MSLPSEPWFLDNVSPDSRDLLIRFWLSAPSDQLEALWNLPFGASTKLHVLSLTSSAFFTPEQVELRNEIGERFSEGGLSQPFAPQLMIVNFLLSPPGLLTINNVETFFPVWLSNAYRELYDKSDLSSSFNSSVVQTESITEPSSDPIGSIPSPPDFGPFPSSLDELVENRIHLNRLLGLSNLYYIDPDDQQIRAELEAIRTSLSSIFDNTPETHLQQYFSTDFGDRYWSLVRSGIQNESLSDADSLIKADSVRRLNPDVGGGFGTSGSTSALLIAMMYFLPGTMHVPEPDAKIPSWLLANYKQIFENAIKK